MDRVYYHGLSSKWSMVFCWVQTDPDKCPLAFKGSDAWYNFMNLCCLFNPTVMVNLTLENFWCLSYWIIPLFKLVLVQIILLY